MIYGLYQSAAGMLVNEYRQDVIANNLANAETVGFKRELATFAERMPASEAGMRQGPSNELLNPLTGGVWLSRTHTDYSEGSMVRTENPLDVALAGSGFLRVMANGEEQLTRDGRMLMDTTGRLVSVTDGADVLSITGQPIRLNPRGGEIAIDEDGRIQQDGHTVARLGVVDVDNYNALRKTGAGRFSAEGTTLTESPAKVMAEYTEHSGVEPIRELVAMIEASRAYSFNGQMVSLQDQAASRLISTVANT